LLNLLRFWAIKVPQALALKLYEYFSGQLSFLFFIVAATTADTRFMGNLGGRICTWGDDVRPFDSVD